MHSRVRAMEVGLRLLAAALVIVGGCASVEDVSRDLRAPGQVDLATVFDFANPDADVAKDLGAGGDLARPPCVGGDVNMVDATSGHCYRLFLPLTNWNNARNLCMGLGPSDHLVTITTAQENGFVHGMIGANVIWIGLNDLVTNNVYVWVTGEAFGYTSWGAGQPNNANGGESCDGTLLNGLVPSWFDDNCNNGHAYLCERD